jgi:hypothetical protein
MAKLSLRQRAKIPAHQFGLPKQRGWPMPDKSHARFAKTQVGRSLKKGNISAGQASRIRSHADRVLSGK